MYVNDTPRQRISKTLVTNQHIFNSEVLWPSAQKSREKGGTLHAYLNRL